MNIKMYQTLPKEAVEIRTEVFMKEQGFKDEFDELDKMATHIVMYESEEPLATCRFFYDSNKEMYVIGRIAVTKKHRGKNYGAQMVKEVENEIIKKGFTKCGLSAQERVSEFYERLGYIKAGVTYLDEGCPHIWMEKQLNP